MRARVLFLGVDDKRKVRLLDVDFQVVGENEGVIESARY